MRAAVRRTVSLLLTVAVVTVAPVVRADGSIRAGGRGLRGRHAAAPEKVATSTATVNYGSGTWGGVANSKAVVGDLDTADVELLGDSITVRCYPAIVAAFAAKGLTVAVRAQSGQQARHMVDQLTAQLRTPGLVVMLGGSNDIFNPPAVAAQVARALEFTAGAGVRLLWADTQVARASQTYTVQYADLRNSGWVNNQIHQGLPATDIIEWNAAIGAAIGRGRPLTYYIQDGVHPWATAGTGHADGCAFLAAVIVGSVRS